MTTVEATATRVRSSEQTAEAAGPKTANRGRLSRTLVGSVLLLYVLYSLAPLVAMLIESTKDVADLSSTSVFSLGSFHLWDNLKAVFTTDGGIYPRWLGNSLLYAGGGAALQALICCFTGYAFDKFDFRGKDRLFAFVLVGALVPTTVLMLPQFLVFSKIGIVNTVWAILLPSIVNPAGVFLARVFSQAYIPDELLEAARLDGAGEVRIFFTVGLRLLGPGFATIAIFAFTSIWQGFQLALIMLNNSKLYPLNLGLYLWHGDSVTDNPSLAPVVMTGSLIAVIPMIIVMVGLQRFWKAGLTAGSIR